MGKARIIAGKNKLLLEGGVEALVHRKKKDLEEDLGKKCEERNGNVEEREQKTR